MTREPAPEATAEFTHRMLDGHDGQRLHVVEHGAGPLVLLVHGFPDTWRTWLHQIRALADAGFRAAAIDLRGCGQGPRPTELFGQMPGPEIFYINWFQQLGAAEHDIERDPRAWLTGFMTALSGGADNVTVFTVPPGGRMSDRFPSGPLPRWLDDGELDVRAVELADTGATGALNRYRHIDRDWEDLAAWQGLALHPPSLFLAGTRDQSVNWMSDAIDAFATTMPGLRTSELLDGAGHGVHQERPGDVNALLLDFLRDLRPGTNPADHGEVVS